MRKSFTAVLVAGVLAVVPASAAAAPLPDNCTKERGQVSCFEGPGKNQGGVGETQNTRGNLSNETNTDPDTCRPAKSQGVCG